RANCRGAKCDCSLFDRRSVKHFIAVTTFVLYSVNITETAALILSYPNRAEPHQARCKTAICTSRGVWYDSCYNRDVEEHSELGNPLQPAPYPERNSDERD